MVLCVIELVTYPGQNAQLSEWCVSLFKPIERIGIVSFVVINLVSTTILVYSLIILILLARRLQGQNLEINMTCLALHALLAILQTVVVIRFFLTLYSMLGLSNEAYTAWALLELVMECMIVYICWTMGSSKELRKYKCLIYTRADGSIKMEMVLITEVGNTAVNEVDE